MNWNTRYAMELAEGKYCDQTGHPVSQCDCGNHVRQPYIPTQPVNRGTSSVNKDIINMIL
jgi:hypothetical protein